MCGPSSMSLRSVIWGATALQHPKANGARLVEAVSTGDGARRHRSTASMLLESRMLMPLLSEFDDGAPLSLPCPHSVVE